MLTTLTSPQRQNQTKNKTKKLRDEFFTLSNTLVGVLKFYVYLVYKALKLTS